MTSKQESIDQFRIRVTIELTKEDLAPYITDAQKQLAQEVKIDGFRKGKVPPEQLKKSIGESAIRERALELAVQGSLAQFLHEQKREVLDQKEFKVVENTLDKLVFSIELHLLPEITLGAYTGRTIETKKIEIRDEQIDKVLEDLAHSRTTFTPADRPIEKGDRVELDIKIYLDGALIENGESKNHPLIMGDSSFMPGFEEYIIGLAQGEKKRFGLSVPKDYYHKTIAGKDIEVAVDVKTVEKSDVPKMDDAFAQSLGDFQTMDQLRANIRAGLTSEETTREANRARLELLDAINKESTIEVPPDVIARRASAMVEDFGHDLESRGMELGPYLAHVKKSRDELEKEWLPQAKRQIQHELIMREIAQKEDIVVDPKEIESKFQALVQEIYARQGEDALQKIDMERSKNAIASSLVSDKIFAFLEKANSFAPLSTEKKAA